MTAHAAQGDEEARADGRRAWLNLDGAVASKINSSHHQQDAQTVDGAGMASADGEVEGIRDIEARMGILRLALRPGEPAATHQNGSATEYIEVALAILGRRLSELTGIEYRQRCATMVLPTLRP